MTLVTNHHRVLALACIVTASTTTLGCIADATDESDERIAETVQAFSSYSSYSWSTIGSNNVFDLDLNLTPAQATCFLRSVGGNLTSGVGDGNGPGRDAFAGARIYNGHWHLITKNYFNTAGMAVDTGLVCLPTATNQVLPSDATRWSKGESAKIIAPAAGFPNRICALSSVQNSMYWNQHGWTSNSDYVQVWSDGTNWWIGGQGSAQGTATCVDRTPGGGLLGLISSSSTNIVQSIDSGTRPLGTQCFLSGVGGMFQDGGAANNGLYVTYSPASHWWSLEADNGKTAWVNCIQ